MAETNQLLINYYKKEEMKKVKKMMEEKVEVGEILENINMEWISKEEVLNIIGKDYESVIKEGKVAEKHKEQNTLNTFSVTQNTPIEIAKKYKNYNYEITNKIAQKIKRDFRKDKNLGEKYILSKEKIESY